MGLNRQQVNKYLSGDTVPSAHNLARIATHFQVPVEELLLPEREFKARRTSARQNARRPHRRWTEEAFPGDLAALRRYCGFYHSHFLSPHSPGMIVRALVRFFEGGGEIHSKSIERTPRSDEDGLYISKYEGSVMLRANGIFVVEYETLSKDSLVETILFPSYRHHLNLLTGLTFGVTSRIHRQPFASRAVWKYLGHSIDIRQALKQCGPIRSHERGVDPKIRQILLDGQSESMLTFGPRLNGIA